jgi:hypothetical protein
MSAQKIDNELKLAPTNEAEVEEIEKPVPRVEKTDYSGAHEKTDPKEIALVRKLDKWIMVSHPANTTSSLRLTQNSQCSGLCIG